LIGKAILLIQILNLNLDDIDTQLVTGGKIYSAKQTSHEWSLLLMTLAMSGSFYKKLFLGWIYRWLSLSFTH